MTEAEYQALISKMAREYDELENRYLALADPEALAAKQRNLGIEFQEE